MKRWPLIASFVLFIALCATLAYWAMQFFKPPTRQVAAPPPSAQAPVNIDAAASLFGGKAGTAVASNFQLKGVIMASNPKDSVVILGADGKPAQAVRAGTEIMPGVRVKEVNRRFVVLSDNGVEKRVDLPEENRLAMGSEGARAAPVPTTSLPSRPAPAMPTTVVNDAEPDSEPDGNRQAPRADSAGGASPSGDTAPAQQSTTSAGANATEGRSAASQGMRPPSAASSSAAPVPSGTGMGSPPITNQGSLAGTGQNSPASAAPAAPGMPVAPRPPQP